MGNVVDIDGKNIPDGQPIADPAMDFVASWERATFSLGGGRPRFNPDNLVRHKGLAIYAEMRKDGQVKAAQQFKRDAIMGRGWSFTYDDTSKLPPEKQKERINLINKALEKIDGSFEDALNAVAMGRDYGYSLTEKVYTQLTINGTPFTGLRMLLSRDPTTFHFDTDDYGMLLKCTQRVNGKVQTIDLSKFVFYVHNPEFDKYYGRSDLREAYKPWYIKERVNDLWALWLERFAGGFMILSQDATANVAPGSLTEKSLQNILQNLHGAAGILLPKGITATVEFPASSDPFQAAVEFQNLEITKSVLMPNLLGFSDSSAGGRKGGLAQSQTQLEAFVWTLNADSRRMEACINSQVVKDLGDLNWGDGEYPCFGFKPASLDWLKWVINQWSVLTAAGAVITTEADEAHLRELMDMPARGPDDKPVVDPLAQQELDAKKAGGFFNKPAAGAPGEPPDTAPSTAGGIAKSLNERIENALERVEIRLMRLEGGGIRFASVDDEARDDHGRWTSGGNAIDSNVNAGRATGHLSGLESEAHSLARAIPASKDDLAAIGSRALNVVHSIGINNNVVTTGHISEIHSLHSRLDAIVSKQGNGELEAERRVSKADLRSMMQGRGTFNSAHVHGQLRSASMASFSVAVQRVAFSVIAHKQETFANQVTEQVADVTARIARRLIGTNEQLQTIVDTDVEDVQSLEPSSSEKSKLNQLYKRALGDAWQLGQQTARTELDQAKGSRRVKFADLREKASAYFDNRAFRMAGDLSDRVRNVIQNNLQTAIKTGMSPQQTRESIWNDLTNKGYTSRQAVRDTEDHDTIQALNDLWVDSPEQAAAYLDTLARTNLFEAMNEARFAEFTDPELNGFVEALEYSAILDDRTTEICSDLDTDTWTADNPLWNTYRPPNHFNCRSILIPVTQQDGWNGEEDPEPDIEPQAGFGAGTK